MSNYSPEVSAVRQASRRIIRELGFLESGLPGHGVTHSQCHALLELERANVLTSGELAGLLNLDRSTMSRALAPLVRAGRVARLRSPKDRRQEPLTLAPRGRTVVRRIHDDANARVGEALGLLDPKGRRAVVRGLAAYADALARARARREFSIRRIRPGDNAEVARIIARVMGEEFGCTGAGFAIHDPEVSGMHAAYTRPRHGYFVLERNGRVVGGAGFGPLAGGTKDVCELRKMYFLADARGIGMGRRMLETVLEAATRSGFRRCYLETLTGMGDARRLYEAAGFRRLREPLGSTGHFGCNAWYARRLPMIKSRQR